MCIAHREIRNNAMRRVVDRQQRAEPIQHQGHRIEEGALLGDPPAAEQAATLGRRGGREPLVGKVGHADRGLPGP